MDIGVEVNTKAVAEHVQLIMLGAKRHGRCLWLMGNIKKLATHRVRNAPTFDYTRVISHHLVHMIVLDTTPEGFLTCPPGDSVTKSIVAFN